jgi:hypothetical protein
VTTSLSDPELDPSADRAPSPLTVFDVRTAQRIRLGAIAFILTGALSLVGLLLRGPNEPASEDVTAFAEAAADGVTHLGWMVLLFGPVVQVFAFLAIWGVLRGTKQEPLAFWGAMLSIAGNALYLPSLGITAFVDSPVAERILAGDPAAVEILREAMFEGAGIVVLLVSALVLIAGVVITSVAIWRSQVLPKWSAVPYAIQVFCLTIAAQFAYPIELTGGVLLMASSVWIGAAMWRVTDPDAVARGV